MRATARALAIEVDKAFADARCPAGDAVAQAPENDEGTAEYFRGKHWRDIDRSDLMRRRFALVAFTPVAFAHFLPAYLLACLESPDRAPLDSLLPALTPPKNNPKRPSYWAWWSLLSADQRRVVIKCLRHWDVSEAGSLSLAVTSLEATVDA